MCQISLLPTGTSPLRVRPKPLPVVQGGANGGASNGGSGDSHDIAVHIAPVDADAFNALDTRQVHEHDLPDYALGRTMNRFRDVLPNP